MQVCTAHGHPRRYFIGYIAARRRRPRRVFIIYLFLIISKIRLRSRHLGPLPATDDVSVRFRRRGSDERDKCYGVVSAKRVAKHSANTRMRIKKNKKKPRAYSYIIQCIIILRSRSVGRTITTVVFHRSIVQWLQRYDFAPAENEL